jgi:hypothetical protein
MPSNISLKDAERRVNYGIQDLDGLADSIAELEAGIMVPEEVHAVTREAAAQVRKTHDKLCELFTVLYATRLQDAQPLA